MAHNGPYRIIRRKAKYKAPNGGTYYVYELRYTPEDRLITTMRDTLPVPPPYILKRQATLNSHWLLDGWHG